MCVYEKISQRNTEWSLFRLKENDIKGKLRTS
jgi:hypothetical protein